MFAFFFEPQSSKRHSSLRSTASPAALPGSRRDIPLSWRCGPRGKNSYGNVRHCSGVAQCCVVFCRGFLRSDAILGTVAVKFEDLETKCDLHDSYDVSLLASTVCICLAVFKLGLLLFVEDSDHSEYQAVF